MRNQMTIRKATGQFFKHWGSYVLLFVVMGAIFNTVAVGAIGAIAEQIVSISGIPYIGPDNLITIAVRHPFGAIALVLLFVLLLAILFVQYTAMMTGVQLIQVNGTFHIRQLLKESFKNLGHRKISDYLVFAVYAVIILPFSHYGFHSDLLSKIVIPKFIFEGMSPVLILLLFVIILIILYLSIRLIYFLPNLIISRNSAKTSIKQSFKDSKHNFWRLFFRLWVVNIWQTVLAGSSIFLLYMFQNYMDSLPKAVSFTSSMFVMTIAEVLLDLFKIWSASVFFMIILGLTAPIESPTFEVKAIKRRRRWAVGFVTVLFLFLLGGNAIVMNGSMKMPLEISHRGVNGVNGVQNTIPAMADTIKSKPDYIEMDIHETKDHKFVVMHDSNLKKLAGVNKAPHDLTLSQLEKLTVKENGYSAKIPSFDEYLAYADAHHQKLLIEIKTSPQDSPNMVKNFDKLYHDDIFKNGHEIHSLSYAVVAQLKQIDPKYNVNFILSYNLVYPHTVANGYTMEQTTLDDSFVTRAQGGGKKVYAWTVDDANSMDNMMLLGVNAIITDDLSELQTQEKAIKDDPSYANRLLTFLPQFIGNDVQN